MKRYESHIRVDFNAYVLADSADEAEEKLWDLITREVGPLEDYTGAVTDVEYDYLSAETLEAE